MSLELSMTELELAMRKLANTVKLDTIEACAKICDRWIASKNLHEHLAAEDIAKAIRGLAAARSPQGSAGS